MLELRSNTAVTRWDILKPSTLSVDAGSVSLTFGQPLPVVTQPMPLVDLAGKGHATPYLSSAEDTVLAKIWDNPEDDIYDTL